MNEPIIALTVFCETPQATQALGARLATILRGGDVVVLSGDLGAGKTTFVKGVVRALGGTIPVTSPTFVLCHLYDTTPVIAHADCWRFDDPQEVIDLALDEVLDDGGIGLIEWGDRAALAHKHDRLRIEFLIDEKTATAPVGEDGSPIVRRRIAFSAAGPRWTKALSDLAALIAGDDSLRVDQAVRS